MEADPIIKQINLSQSEIQAIKDLLNEGFLRKADHPDLPLSIYNYTQRTQFEQNWNPATRMCRGLVLNDYYDIVIRPPEKFFNQGEPLAAKVDLTEARISQKLDGYYISVKLDSDWGLIVTSRGSFDNKYVEAARAFLTDEVVLKMVPNYTYFCELLQNFPGDEAIILTQHPVPKLVCWAIRDEFFNEIIPDDECPFPIAQELSLAEAKQYLEQKVEGVVAQDLTTFDRVKLKTSFYLEMHRLITPLRAWEIVSTGRNIAELNIPDEFIPRMKEWSESLQHQFNTQYHEVIIQSKKYAKLSDKELGLGNIPQPLKSYIFLVRKNKISQLKHQIWKNIRPRGV